MGKTKKKRVEVSTSEEAIAFLGGPNETSRALFDTDARRAMVSMWKTRGKIPAAWRHAIAKAVRAKGGVVMEAFFEVEPGHGFRSTAEVLALTEEEKAFAPVLSDA